MAGLFRELVVKDPRLPFREKDKNGVVRPKRSPLWPAYRKAHLKKYPKCEGCGKEAKFLPANWTMQVHHRFPFYLFPERELDKTTYSTLCGNPRCHLGDGHCGDFKKWNPFVKEICTLRKMLKAIAPKTREYNQKAFIELAQHIASWAERLHTS